MSGFSYSEILFSVCSAIIYGFVFSFFCCIVDNILCFAKNLLTIPRMVASYEIIWRKPGYLNFKTIKNGRVYIILRIFLFAIGFMLLSYLALDGQVRLYMLALSSASYLVSKIAFFGFFEGILFWIFDKLFLFFVIFLRFTSFPFKFIVAKYAQNKK